MSYVKTLCLHISDKRDKQHSITMIHRCCTTKIIWDFLARSTANVIYTTTLCCKLFIMTSERSIIDAGLPADNTVSEGDPIPIECGTPTVSEVENYGWSNQDLQTLLNHFNYHDGMKDFIHSVIRDGPDDIPKPPKPSLQSVLVKPKPKRNLLGLELNEHLKKHLVDYEAVDSDSWDPTSLDSVKNSLQKNFHLVKQNNAKVFSHYMQFGKMLNNAYDYFSVCKLRGNVSQTWAEWLKDNVGISIPYSKQLRSIATTFGVYNGLNYLGISFSEFLKRKEHIRLMFAEFPELDQYWRNYKP